MVDEAQAKEPEEPPAIEGDPKLSDEERTDSSSSSGSKKNEKSLAAKWSEIVAKVNEPMVKGLVWIANKSTGNPRSTIGIVVTCSFLLAGIGALTNFRMEVDPDVLWTPKNSPLIEQNQFIETESGFPTRPRTFTMLIHSNAGNVLGQEQVKHVFEALDTVRNLEDYESVCSQSTAIDNEGNAFCRTSSVAAFWNNSATIFESEVKSDADAIKQMSATIFPDGSPVVEEDIFGVVTRDKDEMLLSSQAFFIRISLPPTDEAEAFETLALDGVFALSEQWDADPNIALQLEVGAARSLNDELQRGLKKDLPLLPLAFVAMGVFTTAVFFKRGEGCSRALRAMGAVSAVLLSLMSGFGFSFLCGVPFTSMTPLLPFVIFGIGLDDAFIVAGTYDRTDMNKDTASRIQETIEEIGSSILLTTISSSLAFLLGGLSSVPGVFWLCYYAVPTIIFVLLYQVTYFVACLALLDSKGDANETVDENTADARGAPFVDRCMERYAKELLKPRFQLPVLLGFVALLVGCAYSATQLTQEFESTDVLPSDSYVLDFDVALKQNGARTSTVEPFAYFRFVDQSDPDIQDQMEQFVRDLVTIDAVSEEPELFWLRDFKSYVIETGISSLGFTAQLDRFLSDPVFAQLYKRHVSRDSSGNIISSRVQFFMDNLGDDVNTKIDALLDQKAFSEAQSVNQGLETLAFFTFSSVYNIWEFFSVTVSELLLSTFLGIGAVGLITLFLVPHWTAVLFILPLISILYVDLLGVLQFAGLHINVVSYIGLVMSIGLMVDFLLHVLLRYFESSGNRHEKVTDTLTTMGVSVLVGGVSTLLGTMPLAFASSSLFNTIFVCFIGLVILGCAHGLIILPILLSRYGSEEQVLLESHNHEKSVYYEPDEALNEPNDLACGVSSSSNSHHHSSKDAASAAPGSDDFVDVPVNNNAKESVLGKV